MLIRPSKFYGDGPPSATSSCVPSAPPSPRPQASRTRNPTVPCRDTFTAKGLMVVEGRDHTAGHCRELLTRPGPNGLAAAVSRSTRRGLHVKVPTRGHPEGSAYLKNLAELTEHEPGSGHRFTGDPVGEVSRPPSFGASSDRMMPRTRPQESAAWGLRRDALSRRQRGFESRWGYL